MSRTSLADLRADGFASQMEVHGPPLAPKRKYRSLPKGLCTSILVGESGVRTTPHPLEMEVHQPPVLAGARPMVFNICDCRGPEFGIKFVPMSDSSVQRYGHPVDQTRYGPWARVDSDRRGRCAAGPLNPSIPVDTGYWLCIGFQKDYKVRVVHFRSAADTLIQEVLLPFVVWATCHMNGTWISHRSKFCVLPHEDNHRKTQYASLQSQIVTLAGKRTSKIVWFPLLVSC